MIKDKVIVITGASSGLASGMTASNRKLCENRH